MPVAGRYPTDGKECGGRCMRLVLPRHKVYRETRDTSGHGRQKKTREVVFLLVLERKIGPARLAVTGRSRSWARQGSAELLGGGRLPLKPGGFSCGSLGRVSQTIGTFHSVARVRL